MTSFVRSEVGAVTVDWVVLSAGLVGLGLAAMAIVSTGIQDVSNDIEAQLKAEEIIVSSFASPPSYIPDAPATWGGTHFTCPSGNMTSSFPRNHSALDGCTGIKIYSDVSFTLENGDRYQISGEIDYNEGEGTTSGEFTIRQAILYPDGGSWQGVDIEVENPEMAAEALVAFNAFDLSTVM